MFQYLDLGVKKSHSYPWPDLNSPTQIKGKPVVRGLQRTREDDIYFHLAYNPCVSVSLVYLIGAFGEEERNVLPGAPTIDHHGKGVLKSRKSINSVEESKGKLIKCRSTEDA